MELITLALSLCLAFNPAPQADSVYFINAEDHIADFFHITAIKETANNYIIYAKFDGQKYKIHPAAYVSAGLIHSPLCVRIQV